MKKIAEKFKNLWRLKNTFLNKTWVREEDSRDGKQYFEPNENEKIIYQNLQDAAKAEFREKFVLERRKIQNQKSKPLPYEKRKRRAN